MEWVWNFDYFVKCLIRETGVLNSLWLRGSCCGWAGDTQWERKSVQVGESSHSLGGRLSLVCSGRGGFAQVMSKSDYYTEERTFVQPDRNTGDKLFGKGLKNLDDTDLEGLLDKLSPEELEDLNNDFDPDNSMLPPSQRCRDQTTKEPTGPFQRDKLLTFLEETAKGEADWEECVPYVAGTKRGKVFEDGDELPHGTRGGVESGGGKEMEMPIELDIEDEEDEDEDGQLDEALKEAPEKDLVDLAGILGMHNLLNQPQYYNALKGRRQDDDSGISFDGVIRAPTQKMIPDEPENETDVDECIQRLEADEEGIKEVNINNMKRLSKERIRTLIKAACASKHIEKLSMANISISDSEARGLIELLESSPSLKILNIESNFITPEMLAKLLRSTLKTQSLVEFKGRRISVLRYSVIRSRWI
ncbi:hypothetical protein PMAYCL1PPCAC_23660 [Pristionchus mayeri]|uniref:Unc-94 n=1 Tax=Pristionchus mayeri TaxID=1317129 RepID=A0AAN5CZV0_9BILA|nr:hypothetical protein PMAYCL1PPCAC_23660 [Pristionchus mayeri]